MKVILRNRSDYKRTYALWIPFHVVLLVGPIVAVLLLAYFAPASDTDPHALCLSPIKCLPSGAAVTVWGREQNRQKFNAQLVDQFLSPSVLMGNFTYQQVKAIDEAWNFAIGRGTQILFLYAIYPIMRRVLLLALEYGPISYPLYQKVALEKFGVGTFYEFCSRLMWWRRHQTQPRCSVGRSWFLFAAFVITVYVLACPSLLSIMTGYQPNMLPSLNDDTNTQAYFTAIRACRVDWIVWDGERVGHQDPTGLYDDIDPVTDLQQYLEDVQALDVQLRQGVYLNSTTSQTFAKNSSPADTSVNHTFIIPPHASSVAQVASNIFWGQNYSLPAPPLNVTHEDNSSWYHITGTNAIYNQSSINAHATCIPTDRYQWGFSRQFVITFLCITEVFIILLVALDWRAYTCGTAARHKIKFSTNRDLLDLAQELKSQLGSNVEDMSSMELDELIDSNDVNVPLDAKGLPLRLKKGTQLPKRRSAVWSTPGANSTVAYAGIRDGNSNQPGDDDLDTSQLLRSRATEVAIPMEDLNVENHQVL